MRVNFAVIALVVLLMGMTRIFLDHDYWLGGASVALAIALLVAHVVRVRRFKRFDQSKTFE